MDMQRVRAVTKKNRLHSNQEDSDPRVNWLTYDKGQSVSSSKNIQQNLDFPSSSA